MAIGLFGVYLGASILLNDVDWTIKTMAVGVSGVGILVVFIGIDILRGGNPMDNLKELFSTLTNF